MTPVASSTWMVLEAVELLTFRLLAISAAETRAFHPSSAMMRNSSSDRRLVPCLKCTGFHGAVGQSGMPVSRLCCPLQREIGSLETGVEVTEDVRKECVW